MCFYISTMVNHFSTVFQLSSPKSKSSPFFRSLQHTDIIAYSASSPAPPEYPKVSTPLSNRTYLLLPPVNRATHRASSPASPAKKISPSTVSKNIRALPPRHSETEPIIHDRSYRTAHGASPPANRAHFQQPPAYRDQAHNASLAAPSVPQNTFSKQTIPSTSSSIQSITHRIASGISALITNRVYNPHPQAYKVR